VWKWNKNERRVKWRREGKFMWCDFVQQSCRCHLLVRSRYSGSRVNKISSRGLLLRSGYEFPV
jgi:hypothetical protein